jgi:PKD repeat protein
VTTSTGRRLKSRGASALAAFVLASVVASCRPPAPAPPPPPHGPGASLQLTPMVGSAPLLVSGDASASTDATPIASYRFDFGDGTVVGPQSGPTAGHIYVSAGVFTVTVTVKDTAGLTGTATATVTVTNSGPPDQPPVAALRVTPSSGGVPLAVSADSSGSTDTDATPIASYRFDFGDGTVVGPQSGPTAGHIYVSAGVFTVTVTVKDTAGLTGTATATVTVTNSGPPTIAVYAGYADTHHDPGPATPNPWQGSPGIVFVGQADSSTGGWDSSAVRIDNTSASAITNVAVTVTVGGNSFALWGSNTIPVGGSLILTQTAFENFDGSDLNPAGCYGCDPTLCSTEISNVVPIVSVAIGGVTSTFADSGQVINTGGVDRAGCPPTSGRNDETEGWQQLGQI